MLSQTAEYALRAVVWLAAQNAQTTTAGAGSSARTTAQIAAGTKVPAGYLAKVMQRLGRASLVKAQRGLGGGFTLARDAAAITALDVVEAVEPIARIIDCPLGVADHSGCLCPLHSRLDQLLETASRTLGSTTIAALVAEPATGRPFCGIPPED